MPKIEGFDAVVEENRNAAEKKDGHRERVSTDRPVQSRMLGSVATGTVSMTSRASSSSKQKSNYKSSSPKTKRKSRVKDKAYQGLYTEAYRSQYEKQRSKENDRTSGCQPRLSATFGSRTGLSLRKPAQLGPSEYSENPEAIGLKVGDAITLRKTDKSKWIVKKPWISVKLNS